MKKCLLKMGILLLSLPLCLNAAEKVQKQTKAPFRQLKPKAVKAKKQKTKSKKQTAKKINAISYRKTNQILEEMKDSDPRGGAHISFRTGATQILSNTAGLETSENATLLTTGFDLNLPLWENFFLEAHYVKHANSLNPGTLSTESSVSLENLFQTSTDIGLKYRFVLDDTKPSNYLGVKLLVHDTSNNFLLADPSESIIITKYEGVVLGIEKGIPITDRLGVDASLDIIAINKVIEQSSSFSVSPSGTGFVVRGEVYYTIPIGSQRIRAAMAYWQSGMVNEFVASSKEIFLRQNQVQTYRMISGSLGYVF